MQPNRNRSLALVVAALALAACALVARPPVDSVADAIVITAAEIETAATQVRALCGNDAPGGPCVEGALIDSRTKDELRARLQDAQDALVDANRALAAARDTDAENQLARAEAVLAAVQSILEERRP